MWTMEENGETAEPLPSIKVDEAIPESKLEQPFALQTDVRSTVPKSVTFSDDAENKYETKTTMPLCEVCLEPDETMTLGECTHCKLSLCHVCHQNHEHDSIQLEDKPFKTKFLPQPTSPTTTKAPRKWSISSLGSTKSDTLEKEGTDYPQAELLGQIDVKSFSDVESVSVIAVKSLSKGSLFVCDSGNRKLKILKRLGQRFEILIEVTLTSKPAGVAFLSSKSAIVSLPEERCLQTFRFKTTAKLNLILNERRRTIFKCFELVKYTRDLITVGQDDFNFYILVLNTEGKVLRCIYKEPKVSSRVLKNLNSLSLSRDGKLLLIMHQTLGCLGMSLMGDIAFKYTEIGEHFHTGLCSDRSGNLFMGCYIGDKIVMMNEYGQKMCDFLAFRRMHPEAIYINHESKLYVFGGLTRKLYCYELKY